MFSRVLTDLERKQIRKYLRQDGDKTVNIQVLVSRARKQLPTIKADLDLLERLLITYSREH
jgi:hypothetical protein